VDVLDRRLTALPWLAFAAVMHPTMALYGAFHLTVQAWKLPLRAAPVLILVPLWATSLVPAPNAAWRDVLATRPFLFPLKWHWYAWLGVVVPLVLLGWFAQVARREGSTRVAHICRRLVLAGILGVAGSLLISTVPGLEPLIPAEPMRTLHFLYILFVLLGGGLLGQHVLRDRPGRWLLFLTPVCLAFLVSNHLFYPASPHIEWPGRVPRNPWVEGFDWVRRNTPHIALFALDPMHMKRPGEDSHGFRAFAERSMLADGVKDSAVAANFPELAYAWRDQVRSTERWREFKAEDFRRLRRNYGVTWVVLERRRAGAAPGAAGLPCPYANADIMVCRIE